MWKSLTFIGNGDRGTEMWLELVRGLGEVAGCKVHVQTVIVPVAESGHQR